MGDARLRVPKDDHTGDVTLGFALPLEHPNEDDYTPDYRATSLVLERQGFGRSEFSLWELTEETDYQAWECVEHEPGIIQLTYDDDKPCQQCVDDCIDQIAEFVHEPDCPLVEDEHNGWDAVEGYWCCFTMRDAYYAAHNKKHAGRSSSVRGCTLGADYYLLDGGDALCTYHLEEEHGRILTVAPEAERGHRPQRDETLDHYFATRDNAGRDLGPTMPNVDVLWSLCQLWRQARILESADRARTKRDETIGRLRGDASQRTIATYSGVSQQRVNQIQNEAEAAHRQWRIEFDTRVAAEADNQ